MTLQLWLLIISSIPFLKSYLQLMPNKTSILVKNGTTFRSEQINAHMTNQWQMWMFPFNFFTTISQENTCYGYDTHTHIYIYIKIDIRYSRWISPLRGVSANPSASHRIRYVCPFSNYGIHVMLLQQQVGITFDNHWTPFTAYNETEAYCGMLNVGGRDNSLNGDGT